MFKYNIWDIDEIFIVLFKIIKIIDFDYIFSNLIWNRCIFIYKMFFIISFRYLLLSCISNCN